MRAGLLVWVVVLVCGVMGAQTVPTFSVQVGGVSYTMAGGDPAKGATTTIPTVLVPVRLEFAAGGVGAHGASVTLDAREDAAWVGRSPVWARVALPGSGGTGAAAPAQYGDALLRETFAAGAPKSAGTVEAGAGWHVLLGQPEVRPVTVRVPVGHGYVLWSGKGPDARRMGVADAELVQREVLRQVGRQDGRLVVAVVRNTAFYALGDATVCCSWGVHGVDGGDHGTEAGKGAGTGDSFVLASVLRSAPDVVTDKDVQPLTEQVAEFLMDPLHDPMAHGQGPEAPGNAMPAWRRPSAGGCAGVRVGSRYFDLEPTDTNVKNNFPAGPAYAVGGYHVADVALLGWYTGAGKGLGSALSYPETAILTEPAVACPARRSGGGEPAGPEPTVAPIAPAAKGNGHALIGYSNGREVTVPQWDVVIISFATPAKDASAAGTMQFHAPRGMTDEAFKQNVQAMKARGQKVMISLGGGGEHWEMTDAARVPAFVDSVTKIVTDWGFDGIDIDFESPSLDLDAGDTDFRHPTTPSIVNLMAAIRQLRAHFGPGFMVSLVPEGTQTPGGYPGYGGAYGSYLSLTWGLRDILTFVDTQSYNTPPLQALDGEIYQPGTVDYHAAMTELLLQGFAIGGRAGERYAFPAVPANKVAVGFWTDDTTPEVVEQTMRYLITGAAPAGTRYKLRQAGGYPGMIGAMFWTADDDRRENYRFSNGVGPELHGFAPAK